VQRLPAEVPLQAQPVPVLRLSRDWLRASAQSGPQQQETLPRVLLQGQAAVQRPPMLPQAWPLLQRHRPAQRESRYPKRGAPVLPQ